MSHLTKAGAAGRILMLATLASCSAIPGGDRATFDNPWHRGRGVPEPSQEEQASERVRPISSPSAGAYADQARVPEAPVPQPSAEIYRGTGGMVDLGSAVERRPGPQGDITLNFQQSNIQEVVKVILGDILNVNYIVDSTLTGNVSLQTSQPLTREDLLPILETLLQLNGAVLVQSNGLYEVLPVDGASVGALVTRLDPSRQGYQLLVIPLRYIAAAEMQKLLEPLKPSKGMLQMDERRNLVMAAGTQQELNNIRETVRVFDVDQLRSMSVGLFRLEAVEAKQVQTELDAIFGDTATGPLAGMVRFIPIERLNALLVITPQAKYLDDARVWVERLDRSENAQGQSIFVYQVQNGNAVNIADVISSVLEGRQPQTEGEKGDGSLSPQTPPPPTEGGTEPGPAGVSDLQVGNASVIADEDNNALLVTARSPDYDRILKVIQKLDVLPNQVLVEATIVEVALEDELRYGLQWYFKGSLGGMKTRTVLGSGLPLTTPGTLSPTGSFTVVNGTEVRALLDLLASDSKINVVSSPTLMVQDNRSATIRVGDQVPVRTSETTNTSSVAADPTEPSALVTSTIQYRDTGVLLEVKPRINTGGMIALEITQEVNDVKETQTSGIDSPTITQRRINTNVAVQSGETLILGGLIKDSNERISEGLPFLRHVPVLGWLFGSQGKSMARTELVVMITPTAVNSVDNARDVTQEYRKKLQGITLPPHVGKMLDRGY